MNLDIENFPFSALFGLKKKFLVSVQEHRGGGQGDFDNVNIGADYFYGVALGKCTQQECTLLELHSTFVLGYTKGKGFV